MFEQLQADFGPFDLDLTADADNHLVPLWLGPGSWVGQDCLKVPWQDFGTKGYSNPPYGRFVPGILKKAIEAKQAGFATTLLLAMRVTRSFRDLILPHASELLFCDSRIAFWEGGQPRWNVKKLQEGLWVADTALFDSIVVRFLPGNDPLQVGVWHVPVHVPAPRAIGAEPIEVPENPGCVACTPRRQCSVHRDALGEKCVRCQGTGRVAAYDENKVPLDTFAVCDRCAGVGLVDKSVPKVRREKPEPDSATGLLASE